MTIEKSSYRMLAGEMMPLSLVWTARLPATVEASGYSTTIIHAAFCKAKNNRKNDMRIRGTLSTRKVASVPG